MENTIAVTRIDPPGGHTPVQLEPGPLSLDDATRRLPGGAYTTFRTFHKDRALRVQDHFVRLRQTAALAGHPVPFSESAIRTVLREMVAAFPAQDTRVRLIVDLETQPGTVYALIEALHVPDSWEYAEGVDVVTRRMHRSNPKAKLTGFIEQSRVVRQELPPGVNEALMIGEDGRVLEGLSSNVFAVRSGEIWTAEEGVLSGITRSVVLDLIRQEGLPLRLEGLPAAEFSMIDEAFLTSASRAVLPVRSIDGQPVGKGTPGPVTRRLLDAYMRRVESDLESI